MKAILVAGRRAANLSYYVHVGDLAWWLFWPPTPAHNLSLVAYLWEDDGKVLGWSLFSPEVGWAFDVFVRPEERASARSEQMFDRTEERQRAIAKVRGGKRIGRRCVFKDDVTLTALPQRRGFVRRDEYMLYMMRPLAEPIPASPLPESCAVRSVAGEHEGEERAAVTHSAFRSPKPFEHYVAAYR